MNRKIPIPRSRGTPIALSLAPGTFSRRCSKCSNVEHFTVHGGSETNDVVLGDVIPARRTLGAAFAFIRATELASQSGSFGNRALRRGSDVTEYERCARVCHPSRGPGRRRHPASA